MIKICAAGFFILLLASESIAVRIDRQMLHIFSVIQNMDDDQMQAVILLVRRADELDSIPKLQFGWKRRGTKNLQKLVNQYRSYFFPTSLIIINDYLRTGKLPEPESVATITVNAMSQEDEITMSAKSITDFEICAGGLALDSSSNSPNEMFANGAEIEQIEEQKKPDISDSLEFKNRVAQGYIALLQDLLCVIPAYPIDTNKNQPLWRKPCKYHFINTLVATAWHPKAFRSAAELESLEQEQGQMLEWVVAQELWRRQCIRGEEPVPEELYFWESDKHELDFVPAQNQFIKVKRGSENPYNYAWFLKNHPKGYLTIINQAIFETERIKGITLENFLLEKF